MTSVAESEPSWGSQYRLVASEKWKAKSAAMGQAVTDALVEYAQPVPGMRVLDLASGTGEPAISLAIRVGAQGHVTALDLSADLLKIAQELARGTGSRTAKLHNAARRCAQSFRFAERGSLSDVMRAAGFDAVEGETRSGRRRQSRSLFAPCWNGYRMRCGPGSMRKCMPQ